MQKLFDGLWSLSLVLAAACASTRSESPEALHLSIIAVDDLEGVVGVEVVQGAGASEDRSTLLHREFAASEREDVSVEAGLHYVHVTYPGGDVISFPVALGHESKEMYVGAH